MPYAYRSLAKAREHLRRKGLVPRRVGRLTVARGGRIWQVDPPELDRSAFGATEFADLCLTDAALKNEGIGWCSCYRRYGRDIEGPNAVDLWVTPTATAAMETMVHPESVRAIPNGTGLWGARFELFDWYAGAAKRWMNWIVSVWTDVRCGDGQRVQSWLSMTDRNGACCNVCIGATTDKGCIRLDNGCAHDGGPNTETHFGGPVLEYFNFSRLLRLLEQWQTVGNLPKSFAENFNVDKRIAPAMKQAYDNLYDLLGRMWPRLQAGGIPLTFDSAASAAAKKRLVAHKMPVSDVLAEQIGPTPHVFETWFNRLRWLAQRTPGGDAWHCVWSTPVVTDADSTFDSNNPWATGTTAVLYKHTPSHTIVASDWLMTVLDLLAPGWARQLARPTAPVVQRPPAAVTAGASVVAAAGAAALVWFLL